MGLPIEKFLSLAQVWNMIMTTVSTLLTVKWLLMEGENKKRKFQTFRSKSGHDCLREVVTYKRFQR